MFRTSIGRAISAAALIVSMSITSLGGTAYAVEGNTNDCSQAAHDRNAAVHLLHDAWKTFRGDLKDLAHDARALDRDTRKAGDSSTDARAIVSKATKDLNGVWTQAHSDIQDAADLGSCGDEDSSSGSTSNTTTTTTSNTTLQTNTSAPAPSDSTSPGDTSGSGHTFDTSGLAKQYKSIVDQAITDMQKIVDDATKAVQALSDATTTKDVTKAVQDNDKAEHDRATQKEHEDEQRATDKAAKNKSNSKNGKNNGKGNGHSHD